MRHLGFVNDSVHIRPLEEQLWASISRSEETVSLQTLKVVLAGIMNFNLHWMKSQREQNDEEVARRVDTQNLGQFEDGHMVLNDNEISWMSKHYLLMQQARQDHLLTVKKMQHTQRILESNQPQ